ncbi:MAG: hypothetical protein LBT00_16435 [Spirochaetaceae bacterium]|nr:hypothetical protein [Spirochaetaceae bacterium]
MDRHELVSVGLLRRFAPRNDNGSRVIASGAKQSSVGLPRLDCFVASLLAMTLVLTSLRAERSNPVWAFLDGIASSLRSSQ